MSTLVFDVAIVGGGIAGLAAAWYAQKRGLSYIVLECDNRLGGKVHSEQIWDYGDAPFTVEYGPDGFITRKPWAYELAIEIGADFVPINDLPKRIYVLSNGKLHRLPDGLHLLVPTKPLPFLQSSLFSWSGKLRMLLESFIPPRADDSDESLADFIRRRLGAEALDKLGEPMLAGVYNADAEKMSIKATFGMFRVLEQKHGSLLHGMQARSDAPKSDLPPLVSMRNGMGTLADSLAEKLTGDVRVNAPAHHIEADGNGYQVLLDDEVVSAQSVILATPANISTQLIQTTSPDVAELLSKIRYEGVGSMAVAYRVEDVPHPMDAYGVVIPSSEKRRIDGITFASTKWANRAPDGYHLLRVFFGGPNTRDMLDKSDEDLLATVCGELRDLLGITAEPLFYRVGRWQAAYPQYDVGHAELVKHIRETLPQKVFVAGLSYDGVGIPDTIHGAKTAVETITIKDGEKIS